MKIVLLIISAFIISIGLKAQDYPIFTSKSVWYVDFFNPAIDTSQAVFSIPVQQPDTIINSQMYKKLVNQEAAYNSSTGTYGPLSSPIYQGGLRNDSIEKKVYYVYYGDTSEYLIYNFNASTGDTLFKIYNPLEYDSCDYKVSQIDTIILCGKAIRHFTLNRINLNGSLGFDISWYEGWGGAEGIVTTRSDANLYCCFTLLCFSSNDTVYSPAACYPGQCQLPTGVEGLSINENTFIVYPNPSNEVFNIKAESFRNAQMFVYDMSGRVLLQQSFNSQAQLNTATLTQGIYIAEIKDKSGKSVRGRLLKE